MTNRGARRQESLRELVTASARVAAVPGLAGQAVVWQTELTGVRRHLEREAVGLAAPRLWPDTLGGLAGTSRRVLGAAGPDAPLALLTAAATGAGLPIAPPASSRAVLRRAERLVRAGGPVYIKLGQFIASSRGLLPDEWVEAFAWCRDDAPRLAPGVAAGVLQRELEPGSIIDFDDEPLAAGSIGQVHFARLPDGTKVVVKIRRPGLRGRFRRDIETLALVAAGAHKVSPALRAANLRGFVELFAELSLQELDFRLEALNAVESAAVLDHAGLKQVGVPLPRPHMVTARVLVMPFVVGVRYDQAVARFGDDLDGDDLLRVAVRAVLASMLLYGVSHGDLHAGNVLVPAPGRFNLLDFGICARLTPDRRSALMRFLLGFAASDATAQVAALCEFGTFDPDDTDILCAQLQIEIDALQRRAHGAVTFDRLGTTVCRLLRVFAANGFTMPKELVLFFKNLMYLSSFAATVAPDVDLFDAVVAVVGELAAANAGHPVFDLTPDPVDDTE